MPGQTHQPTSVRVVHARGSGNTSRVSRIYMISEALENAINPSLAKAFNMKEHEKPKTKQKQKRPHVS